MSCPCRSKGLLALFTRKLGVCRTCMRLSIVGSLVFAGAAAVARETNLTPIVRISLLVIAIGFAVLAVAHLVAFTIRVAPRLRTSDSSAPTSRRGFLATVVKAGVLIAPAYLLGLRFASAAVAAGTDYDVDCGNGYSCPDSHPNCCPGGKCCQSEFPHYCTATKTCYRTLTAAKEACTGGTVHVCGRPR